MWTPPPQSSVIRALNTDSTFDSNIMCNNKTIKAPVSASCGLQRLNLIKEFKGDYLKGHRLNAARGRLTVFPQCISVLTGVPLVRKSKASQGMINQSKCMFQPKTSFSELYLYFFPFKKRALGLF